MNILAVTPSNRNFLYGIIFAAAVLRLGAVLLFHPPLISDEIEYDAIARSLVHGDGFSLDGKPTAYRLPGYPFLLAGTYWVFGDAKVPVWILQTLSDLLSCLFLFAIGKKLFSEKIGLIAAAILAFFPIQILYASHMMTETVFTTIFLATLWHIVKEGDEAHTVKNNIMIGLLIGAGVLVRSTVVLLPLIIFLHRWKSARPVKANIRSLIIIGITAFLVISPWLVRNYIQFQKVSLMSNVGVNFWIGNHPGANGSFSFPKQNNPLYALDDDFKKSDLGIRLGIEFIAARPVEYCVLLGKKFVRFFSSDYWLMMSMEYKPEWAMSPNAATVYSQLSFLNVVILHLPYVIVLLMGTFGLVCNARDDDTNFFFLRSLILYWLVIHLVFFGDGRLRFPIMPLFFLSAAYGLEILRKNIFQCSTWRLTIVGLLYLLFIGGWIGEYVVIHSKMIPVHPQSHALIVKDDKIPRAAPFHP